MNIIARTFLRLAKAAAGSQSFDAMNHDMVSRVFGSTSSSGKAVTESSAMSLTTAWSCMRILSETIGAIPWGVYEKDSKGNAHQVDHPISKLLSSNGSPNRDMTSVEYKEAKTLNLCQNGNAYSLVDKLGNDPVSLYPMRSSLMQVKQKEGSNTRLSIPEGEPFYQYNDRGKTVDYPREKIWHVKGFGGNGLVGLSPLGAARESMGFALALDEFGSRFFSHGGKPSGIVTIPGWLKDDQRDVARENLQQMLGGLQNMHKFALFEGGMKPEPWGEMPLKDMELLLLKKFSIAEVCRIYRIPPHMVADLENGASYASIEMMSAEFITFTLMPYFTRFEASAAKWLIAPKDRDRYFLRFNYEAFLRADSAGRASFYNSALQNGWMNRNEVRNKENLGRVDGLDEYTVQSNMTPVDLLASIVEASAARGNSGGKSRDALTKYLASLITDKEQP